jgi:hypothetical protein
MEIFSQNTIKLFTIGYRPSLHGRLSRTESLLLIGTWGQLLWYTTSSHVLGHISVLFFMFTILVLDFTILLDRWLQFAAGFYYMKSKTGRVETEYA